MWENPKLFWARACMGEIFGRIEKELPGFFWRATTKLPAIPAKNAGKREENGRKRWKTILAFCRGFAGDWCQNGVIVFVGDGFQDCRRCFERLVSGLVSSFLGNYYPFAGKF